MNAWRHVVWDWNGTLLDDAWLCLEVINALLAQQRLPQIDAQRYGAVFGFPLDGYCRELGFPLAERAAYERLSDDFSALYEPRRLECCLRSGARAVLARVRFQAGGQSLLSAYSHRRLVELVGAYGLEGCFDAVVGAANDYGEGKVELGRRHLSRLGCQPAEVLVVGDTLHDLDVARAMGAGCVLIDSGHQHADRLRAGGATVIASLEEVATLVAGGQPEAQRARPADEERQWIDR